MSPDRRYLWIAVAVVTGVAVLLLLAPRVREELAPEPEGALVAVAVGDSPMARVGRTAIASGESFRLHAVLTATDRQGEPIYYTEAERMEVDGVEVPVERLRRWDRPGRVVVLWFTVEGYRPFLEVGSDEPFDSYRFEEVLRPEWGRGWTIAGSVTPRNHSLARGFEPSREVPFGTARYHVRIERFARDADPAPAARYRSPTGADLVAGGPLPSSVEMTLEGVLAGPSAVFGLPHFEPTEGAPREMLRRLADWYRRDLVFSRPLVLSQMLAERDLTWGELTWSPLDLAERPIFEPAGVGDLLRSGERIVVIYRDVGEVGRLDYDDLCFDFLQNAAVRPLREVFTGGGVLEWADLAIAEERGD